MSKLDAISYTESYIVVQIHHPISHEIWGLTVVTHYRHVCNFLKWIQCDSSFDPPDPKQDATGLKSGDPDAALCENRLRVSLPLPRAQVQSCDNMRGQRD